MEKTNFSMRRLVSALFLVLTIAAVSAFAQTSAFTYQGRFTDAGVQQPTNGTYSMTFRLYDAASGGGNQIGAPITTSVTVVNGIFAARLDFGAAAFSTTGARYLEIQVGASVLTPRQEITSAPFSIRASNAGSADSLSANCVSCVADAQINSVSGAKITGTVANAANAATANAATTAGNVTGVVAIANGGTGSATQNFVDLTTAQTVAGNKTFSGLTNLSGGTRLQNLAFDPEAASAANAGRVYYNTAIGNLRLSDGTKWITAGQPVIYHVYNTAIRVAVTSTVATQQPGMTQTITVPNGFTANVVIQASIGTRNAVNTANGWSNTDFVIYIDNNFLPKGGWNRFTTVNNGSAMNGFTNSTITTAATLNAGTHTVEVRTARSNGTVAVDIGGNASNDTNAAEMTLTVYYTPITFVNRLENAPTNDKPDQSTDNKRIIAPSSKN